MKVLGEKYGIQITKPWSQAMYDHNEKVATQMKAAIMEALTQADKKHDTKTVAVIAKAINAYGYAQLQHDYILSDAISGLQNVQNYWLHGDCWPDLLKAGLVKPLEMEMIGYDK